MRFGAYEVKYACGPARPIRALSRASGLTACTASSPPRMRKPNPVFSLSRCTSTSSYSGPEKQMSTLKVNSSVSNQIKGNLNRQCSTPHGKSLSTHVGSRRWPSTFHKGRRGQACLDRSPLWSRAQTYGAVAGLERECQAAKPGQTGLLVGCHVGPIGQATMRRTQII